MFSGFTSKVSEAAISLTATINPLTDLVHVTSTATTTVVATIVPPFAGFSGITFIANRSGGNITTTTTGNILAAVTIPNNIVTPFIYSLLLGKYIPGPIS